MFFFKEKLLKIIFIASQTVSKHNAYLLKIKQYSTPN
jgi:hypothetical protein